MPDARDVVVQLRAVRKHYHALRPLRVEHFELRQGQSVALLGLDAAMAEVLVNLITGAMVPDAGEVTVMGRLTSSIPDAVSWMDTLDQLGLVSDRAVLVEQFTTEQNLSMPLSLDFEGASPEFRRAVRQLADEVGISEDELRSPTGSLSPQAMLRLRLGRALALGPRVLMAEHPNAGLSPHDLPVLAADWARVVSARGLASLVLTADRAFAAAIAEQVLVLEPATGVIRAESAWRRWFGAGPSYR